MSVPNPDRATVHRFEVRTRPGLTDPRARSVIRAAEAIGLSVERVAAARVYLVQGDLSDEQLMAVREKLLTNPVTEQSASGATPAAFPGGVVVEVHPLPGVMDPAALSVRDAILEFAPGVDVQVSTGSRFDLAGVTAEQATELARRRLANTVVQQITSGPWTPSSLPRGGAYSLMVRNIPIRELTEEQLTRLSRDAHLFLSLAEMSAVQQEFRTLGREPTDIELETIAQTWSEHCVHKTLKSRITYREEGATVRPGVAAGSGAGTGRVLSFAGRPGHTVNADGSVTIENLLKSTVAAATFELIEDGVDWTLSVFKDNSGVVELDEENAVCIKVETHNHPSAIEPYGGAATGAGGCIRDVMGTGLGARPVANTDVFCVALPGNWTEGTGESSEDLRNGPSALPPGCLPPRRTLSEVVSGVRDYGNRMGIPTLNGAVSFDDRYIGNPLVFCGCIGVIPRNRVNGAARPGDRIIALGGRTGRDGIHGATFSSAELEHTAADEFSHAVQIGNAIEEKRLMDAILRARDEDPAGPLFSAITDCGAGGFSSAVGEMGAKLGAEVHLDQAPLKYAGLSYTEIWISEAQERMILAVPPEKLAALKTVCAQEHVELADLGQFGTENAELRLHYAGTRVGTLPMGFIHDGIPTPTREAAWKPARPIRPRLSQTIKWTWQSGARARSGGLPAIGEALLALLAHPSIASKHWIIRQYDHEVQGNTVIKPLVGPGGRGPGNASVIEPIPGSGKGVAVACGLQTGIGDPAVGGDPYLMALAAIDECVRNLVCTGADPARIAILDNFCWPSCDKPANLASLVRAAEGCYDGAKAYRTPFVSGKDSLNNQLRYQDPETGEQKVIEIPPTLLITGLGLVQSLSRCMTMDAKSAGNTLLLIGTTTSAMAGSHYQQLFGIPPEDDSSPGSEAVPATDLAAGPATAKAVAELIRQGLIASAHDCSDGGFLAAVSEMLIASGGAGPSLGADVTLAPSVLSLTEQAFAETPSRYVVEVRPADMQRVRTVLTDHGAIFAIAAAKLNPTGRLTWAQADLDAGVEELATAWRAPLDW